MARLTDFLRRLIRFAFILVALASILFTIQTLWHVFDPLIAYVDQDVDLAGATLSAQILAGVSVAALALFLVFLIIAIAHRGVNNHQFVISFLRNILSSAVFLVSDWAFTSLQKMGRFYLILALVSTLVVTIILIEMITKASKRKEEVSVRTDLLASIVAGLAFGLILATGQFAWSWARHFLPWK